MAVTTRTIAVALLLALVWTPSAAQKATAGESLTPATVAGLRKQADQLFGAGKTEEAKAAYLRLAPYLKDDFEFNKRLAYCFSVSPKREMDKASLYYGRAHALDPKDAQVERDWGKALSWSKQYPAAIAVFEKIVARNPADKESLLELARAQSYAQRAEAARASYLDYLKRWPQDRKVRLEYAGFLGWSKHPDEALEAYREVRKTEPHNVAATVGEARVLAWQGKLEQALELYNQALQRAPNHYDAIHGKAFALLWLQRYDEAEKTFARANRIKPPDNDVKEAMRRIARWKADEPQRKKDAEIDVYRKPAEAAMARNDLPQAIELFHKALTVAPGDPQLRLRLGQAYLWNQQWTEAIDLLEKLYVDHPDQLSALAELGHAQAGNKQLDEAAKTYRSYLERSPEVAVRLDLARVLSWANHLEEARAEYQEILSKAPDNFEAGLGMAQVTSWQGKTAEALERYEALLKVKPGSRDALLGKAQVLSWSGRTKESLVILEELRATLPQDREIAGVMESVQEADRQQAAQQQGGAVLAQNLTKRIEDSEAAVQRKPDDVSELQKLADLYAQKRDFERSTAYYEKALALRPNDTDLKLTVARVTSWNRSYARSIELYRQLLAEKPDSREYRLELARILSWAGRNSESIDVYRELLQKDPKDTEARMGLAQVLSWDKRLDESLAEYVQLLKDDPANQQIVLQQARVLSWKGDLASALRLYDDLLIKDPYNREARLGKAQVLNWSGQPRAAKGIIEDIQKKYPDDRDVAMANASVQSSLGRKDLALRQLDELDKLQPGSRDTESLRRSIRQDLRPTLIMRFTPSHDSGDTNIYASTATLYFNLNPQIRSYIATNLLPTSDPVNGREVGTEFMFGSYGRVKDWLQLRGEIGVNAPTEGDVSPIGGGGATIFATDKMQFDFDVSRRFINYLAIPIRSEISRMQYRTAWNWRLNRRANFHFDYYHEDYSDTNSNNGANFSLLVNAIRGEHFELETGYLYAVSGFTKDISSGYYAPTSFQRHAALGNMRIKFSPNTGISFWGSLGRESALDQAFRTDGTALVSWDYKLSPKVRTRLGYGYFAVSSVGSTGAYVTHTGYSTIEYVF